MGISILVLWLLRPPPLAAPLTVAAATIPVKSAPLANLFLLEPEHPPHALMNNIRR